MGQTLTANGCKRGIYSCLPRPDAPGPAWIRGRPRQGLCDSHAVQQGSRVSFPAACRAWVAGHQPATLRYFLDRIGAVHYAFRLRSARPTHCAVNVTFESPGKASAQEFICRVSLPTLKTGLETARSNFDVPTCTQSSTFIQ